MYRLVGAAGFEPTLAESESDVLPLNYAPMRERLYIYFLDFANVFFKSPNRSNCLNQTPFSWYNGLNKERIKNGIFFNNFKFICVDVAFGICIRSILYSLFALRHNGWYIDNIANRWHTGFRRNRILLLSACDGIEWSKRN